MVNPKAEFMSETHKKMSVVVCSIKGSQSLPSLRMRPRSSPIHKIRYIFMSLHKKSTQKSLFSFTNYQERK